MSTSLYIPEFLLYHLFRLVLLDAAGGDLIDRRPPYLPPSIAGQ